MKGDRETDPPVEAGGATDPPVGATRRAVVGIVPCAGRSRRMGRDKALLEAGGRSFLARVVEALAAGCDRVIVVVRAGRTDLAAEARAAGAEVLENPDPIDGPISSVRIAVAAAPGAAILLLPVDHPAVDSATVRRLADAARRAAPDAILLPTRDGNHGHPTAFGPALAAELLDPALEGGARTVVHRDPARVVEIAVDDPGVLLDLDTPAEVAAAVEAGTLAPPDAATLPATADRILRAVDAGGEAVVFTRFAPLPPLRRSVTLASRAAPPVAAGTLGDPSADARADALVLDLLAGAEAGGTRDLAGLRVHVEVHRPPPELVIVGAGHISIPLAEVGRALDFRVRVLDDRPDFARAERFPIGTEVRRVDFARAFDDLPIGPHSHVVLVTRGHRYDYECLLQLLRADPLPGYLGMIGSRRRVRATWVRLIEEGIPRERIARVRAPIGLDLGAETPGEIAVAVAAEIVRERRGGSGRPLAEEERVLERFFDEAPVGPGDEG